MFKDKLNKMAGAAKKKVGEKVNDAMNSNVASEMKNTVTSMAKDGILGGIEESLKAGSQGGDAGKAFQDHMTNWQKNHFAQRKQSLKQEFKEGMFGKPGELPKTEEDEEFEEWCRQMDKESDEFNARLAEYDAREAARQTAQEGPVEKDIEENVSVEDRTDSEDSTQA